MTSAKRALSVMAALLLLACGGAPGPVDTALVDRDPDPVLVASRRLLARRPAGALLAMPIEAREEAIFAALYNELEHPKPRATSADAYVASLHRVSERTRDAEPWHVRWGVEGMADLEAATTRLYFDVLPEHAGTLADELTAELDRRGLRRYSFKVVGSLELIDVPVAAVLYVEGADLEAGRDAALAFVRAHPDALWPEEAPLTLRLAPGLSIADEIGAIGPPGVAGNSFGGAMAHLFAQAIEGADVHVDAEHLAERMRVELERAGFDATAPWLRPRITSR